MADGYARVTGKPQCVIVHVDVGTQALGVAVHNASVGRAPVLIFAGLSPFTQEGELRGSRTEFIHWLQDTPDQRAIVSQYCRYTAELKTGANVKQMVNRALQFATSASPGPVYLCAAREVIEADVKPYDLDQDHWGAAEMGGLLSKSAAKIATALARASNPLVVTGYSGRDHKVPAALVQLADTVKCLRVLDMAGSDMCFPADHPAWLGVKQGVDDSISEADVILVIHCDVPWIHTRCRPRRDAVIFHIDIDPLKTRMPLFYIPANATFMADALTSIEQIQANLRSGEAASILAGRSLGVEEEARKSLYTLKLENIEQVAKPRSDGSFGSCYLSKKLRSLCPPDTIWVIEAVTNTCLVHDGIQPTLPGSWINCGGGGLGWSGGATLGVKLASDAESNGTGRFVCQIVGDGTYLFSSPASVYWIAMRYKIPVLTIVLNNDGKYCASFLIFVNINHHGQAGMHHESRMYSSTQTVQSPGLQTRTSAFHSPQCQIMPVLPKLQERAISMPIKSM